MFLFNVENLRKLAQSTGYQRQYAFVETNDGNIWLAEDHASLEADGIKKEDIQYAGRFLVTHRSRGEFSHKLDVVGGSEHFHIPSEKNSVKDIESKAEQILTGTPFYINRSRE